MKDKKDKLQLKSEIQKQWKVPILDAVEQSVEKKTRIDRHLDYNKLRAIVIEHAEKLDDNEGIMELLPDLEQVREILVSTILSPTDMKDTNLNITVDKDAPPEIAELIKEHFSTVYDLNGEKADILGKALFSKGSYPIMVIPPSAVSNLIKENTHGLESISELDSSKITNQRLGNIGIIYNDRNKDYTYAFEAINDVGPDNKPLDPDDLFKESYVEITDNLLYLAQPAIADGISSAKVKDVLMHAYGLEAIIDKKTNNIYKNRSVAYKPFIGLKTELVDGVQEKDVDEDYDPLVITLPPESVVPVHKPSEPKEHVGYLIFIDEDGVPIHYAKNSNKWKQLNQRLENQMENQTLMNHIGLGVSYVNNNLKQDHSTEFNKTINSAYQEQFEAKLTAAIGKGVTGKKIQVADLGEFYRIMLYRQLEKQKTRILYVPAEMITYIAFNYSETGHGISLLEKTKLYASFRAILTFAMVMTAIKSSVNLRRLEITLDEDDIDPQSTVEQILNEYVALQASGVPIGRLNPLDIIDSLQKSGIQVKINGGSRFPGTEIDVVETKKEITPPDTGIMDMLKDIHYAGLWVSREDVDKTGEADFAATVISNNLIKAKKYALVQKDYTGHLTDFVQKYISHGGSLFSEIKKKFEELGKKSKLTMPELIASIKVVLPQPDDAVIKAQSQEYDDFCSLAEKVIDNYISEGMIKDMLTGEYIGLGIEDVKACYLNLLKRQFLRSKNIMPEIDAILINPENNVEEQLSKHNDTVMKLIADTIKHVKKVENKEEKEIQAEVDKLNPPPPEETDDGMGDMDNGEGEDTEGADDGSTEPTDDEDDFGVGDKDLPTVDEEEEEPDDTKK